MSRAPRAVALLALTALLGCSSVARESESSTPAVVAPGERAPALELEPVAPRRTSAEWEAPIAEGQPATAPVPPVAFLAEDEEHGFHRNHAGLFLGVRQQLDKDQDLGTTVGLAYERRFSETLGFEGLAEYTAGSHARDWMVAVGPTVRPTPPLKLLAGAGIEVEDESGGQGHFVVVLAAAYSFPLGKNFSLAPTLYVDFLGETGTNVLLGLALGRGF